MQVATDLGTTLASAATSLASQPPTTASDLELPVATQGTEQWAGVVAKALTAGGMSHTDSLQALQGFKSAVAAKMAKTVSIQRTVCINVLHPLLSAAFRCHSMPCQSVNFILKMTALLTLLEPSCASCLGFKGRAQQCKLCCIDALPWRHVCMRMPAKGFP